MIRATVLFGTDALHACRTWGCWVVLGSAFSLKFAPQRVRDLPGVTWTSCLLFLALRKIQILKYTKYQILAENELIQSWNELLVKVPPVEMSIDKTEVWAFNLLPQWYKLCKSMEIIIFYINREWELSLCKTGAIPTGVSGAMQLQVLGMCPGWRGAKPALSNCSPSPVHCSAESQFEML